MTKLETDLKDELETTQHSLNLIDELCDIVEVPAEATWRRVKYLCELFARELPRDSLRRELIYEELAKVTERNQLWPGHEVATMTQGQGLIVGVDGDEFCVKLTSNGERCWFARHELRKITAVEGEA